MICTFFVLVCQVVHKTCLFSPFSCFVFPVRSRRVLSGFVYRPVSETACWRDAMLWSVSKPVFFCTAIAVHTDKQMMLHREVFKHSHSIKPGSTGVQGKVLKLQEVMPEPVSFLCAHHAPKLSRTIEFQCPCPNWTHTNSEFPHTASMIVSTNGYGYRFLESTFLCAPPPSCLFKMKDALLNSFDLRVCICKVSGWTHE